MRKLEKGERKLTVDWLRRLARAFDVTPDEIVDLAGDGLREGEVRLLADCDLADEEFRLARLLYPGQHADTMLVSGRALELEGYLPGDRILVDMKCTPQPGDPVVAQIYDAKRASGPTVLRIFKPPLLLVRSTQTRYEPCLLSDNHVGVRGVIVGRYSSRALDPTPSPAYVT